VPVREFNGWMNGLKAGLDVLAGRAKGFGYGRSTKSYRDNNNL
jgi:hypothetical protein